jgi:hypothetical protein
MARAGLPAGAFDAVRARQALPRVLCTDGGLVMR